MFEDAFVLHFRSVDEVANIIIWSFPFLRLRGKWCLWSGI